MPDDRCFLLVANSDGSEERILATRRRPFCYRRTVWSPDGKTIIAQVGQTESGDANTELIEISASDASERPISSHRWYNINSLAWLPGKSGLILAGREKSADVNQLWQVAYPSDKARRLTNDSTNYAGVTLTRDADRLLVVQVTLDSYLTEACA